MPFIAARDGTQLFWRDWGQGAPMLFLNSMGLGSQMWDYQMTAFADHGFRCIGFDRRGHGRSDQPARGYDHDTFADDVATLVDALDLSDLTGGRRMATATARRRSSSPGSHRPRSSPPHGLIFTHMERLHADILQFVRET